MKYLAIAAFLSILASLAVALFFMLKSDPDEKSRARKMALSLTLRVSLSVLLFLTILGAWRLGLITPTGIP